MDRAMMEEDWDPARSSPQKAFTPRQFHEPFSPVEIYWLRKMARQYYYVKKFGAWALGGALILAALIPLWDILKAAIGK